MSVVASITQAPSTETVELLASRDYPDELWVHPLPVLGEVDLPRLRHLLPVEFQSASVVDFIPTSATGGAWILRKAV